MSVCKRRRPFHRRAERQRRRLRSLWSSRTLATVSKSSTRTASVPAQPTVMDCREEAARGRQRYQVPERVVVFPESVERRNDYGAPVAPTICNCFKPAAAVDGIAGRIGGHPLRVASARELAAHGASVAELQQAGGWESPATPGVYIRREAAARGPVARRRYEVCVSGAPTGTFSSLSGGCCRGLP